MNFHIGLFCILILFVVQMESTDPCQTLKCHPRTEICRRNTTCLTNNFTSCYSCVRKTNLPSSLSSYDDYYEYDDESDNDERMENDAIVEKADLNDYQDYHDDYVEPFDRSKPVRKLGTCPSLIDAVDSCNQNQTVLPLCQTDNDCPGDLKCCAAACEKRTCTKAIQLPLTNCPKSFQCSLNCRLGYQVDSNGCLMCECQSCPSMDQCHKSCPSGYLKDLFNCDMCECRDECPPFICRLLCPSNVGFAQSETGCPLCQCATSLTETLASNASCEKDVHCPAGFRCVTDAQHVPMCQAVSSDAVQCPPMKCPTGCDTVIRDVNGCATCQCRTRQCSRVMCRMYCLNGFKRDENGCEICSCNAVPQPCPSLACEQTCRKYRQDYSGCPTCDCDCPIHDCPQSMNCSTGLKVDADGCTTCTCNDDTSPAEVASETSCSKVKCRMFCMYGFRRNEKGCELCECDWSPIAENIQCSERVPCPGSRVCNLNLKLCEIVDSDRVNWFVYDFELKSNLLTDEKFISTFKSGLIHNIASKYGLRISQITVSKVDPAGTTSFQVMPYFDEDMDDFQTKIDQIDADLNSHEFRSVLPAIVDVIGDDSSTQSTSVFERTRCRWNRLTMGRRRFFIYVIGFLLGVSFIALTALIIKIVLKKTKYAKLDECQSKASADHEDDKEALVNEKRDPHSSLV